MANLDVLTDDADECGGLVGHSSCFGGFPMLSSITKSSVISCLTCRLHVGKPSGTFGTPLSVTFSSTTCPKTDKY